MAAGPTHIGNYSIVEQIGAGATSNVYHAQHVKTFASVAIKQLRRGRQSEIYQAMFATEAELGRRMRHKNIVHVLDADLNDAGGAYLVMEYIKGAALDHHDRANSLPPILTVLSVVEQIANALRYAAELGVVHRDVKPGNIILRPDGLAKLSDFGCAIPVSAMGEVVAGSLAYMSPEQLDGEALDQRADIYALGAVIYRLLTGRHTFEADNVFDAQIAIHNYPITPIATWRKKLPQELIAVIERALEKDREQRYATWDEFISDFGNAAHKIRMSDYDLDLYRGFSMSTQSVLSSYMSADHAFSKSGFSRSTMQESYGV
ncbi:MAG: serine/threonine-protein kinase [Proteobacteria bacterium]|nr:serine/threonine-protein kinase [Pseudomonadota bacterium]